MMLVIPTCISVVDSSIVTVHSLNITLVCHFDMLDTVLGGFYFDLLFQMLYDSS